jgi:hypothetical protein
MPSRDKHSAFLEDPQGALLIATGGKVELRSQSYLSEARDTIFAVDGAAPRYLKRRQKLGSRYRDYSFGWSARHASVSEAPVHIFSTGNHRKSRYGLSCVRRDRDSTVTSASVWGTGECVFGC